MNIDTFLYALETWNNKPQWIRSIERSWDNQIHLLVDIETRNNRTITIKVILGNTAKFTRKSCTIFIKLKDELSAMKHWLIEKLASYRNRSNRKPRSKRRLLFS